MSGVTLFLQPMFVAFFVVEAFVLHDGPWWMAYRLGAAVALAALWVFLFRQYGDRRRYEGRLEEVKRLEEFSRLAEPRR